MKCAWKELLHILPAHLRREVDILGAETAQEIRLRLGCCPALVLSDKRIFLSGCTTQEDLNFVVNAASRYSPWSAATAADGYITAPGGHRIGLCGEAVVHNSVMTGFRSIRSLNIRVARDFPGLAESIASMNGSILILGPPGSGKTTLLRDLIRQRSKKCNVAVVDERGELFPPGLEMVNMADIITGCSKTHATMTLLRTMTPDTIALDEITDACDAQAMMQIFRCGVQLLATAHGNDISDFRKRRVYVPIVESGVIDYLVILNRNRSYRIERLCL